MKNPLWTRNFSLLIAATTFGCMGGIVGNFALSFLVFDETGSTFASALVIAIQLIPNFLIPLLVAPWMDRFPRKPFLVFGDFINDSFMLLWESICCFRLSYVGYLGYSLLLATLGSLDELAYNSIFSKDHTKWNGTKRICHFFHVISPTACDHAASGCSTYGYDRYAVAFYRPRIVFHMCCTH